MNPQNWFQFVLDWVGLPSLALLAIILIYRRWYREFPFFFLYVLSAGLVGIARLFFLEEAPTRIYSRVYWVSDAALAAFSFLATYELFFKRLFSGFNKTRFYRFLFPAAAILVTSVVAGGSLIGGHISALALTTRIFVFLQAAILVFFVALMIMMGRRWSKQEFAIAFGFGLDVSTSSILLGILSHTAIRNELLTRIEVIAYDLACLIWLCCFWTPPKAQNTTPPALSTETLQEARKWEDSLKDFMSQGKR
jgi:hypothetical protein